MITMPFLAEVFGPDVGQPFVGPAGRILDQALAAAGIARGDVYVTNAVKHFRWEARGKRRIHKKPTTEHVRACRPWWRPSSPLWVRRSRVPWRDLAAVAPASGGEEAGYPGVVTDTEVEGVDTPDAETAWTT